MRTILFCTLLLIAFCAKTNAETVDGNTDNQGTLCQIPETLKCKLRE